MSGRVPDPLTERPRAALRRLCRALGLLGLTVAVGACGPVRPTTSQAPGTTPNPLASLRAAAALPGCPAGLGATLPAVTLPCLAGGVDVTLQRPGDGHPMLVNIWATWCSPCVREVPRLVQFAAAAAGRVEVVGVLTDDDPGTALQFARQFHLNYPSVVDAKSVVLHRFSPGPPTTLFLRTDGTLAYVKRGEITDGAALRALVVEHLGVAVG